VSEPVVEGVLSIQIPVSNLDRIASFYESVLDFDRVSGIESNEQDRSRSVRLGLGEETIRLVEYAAPGRPVPADSRSNDLWFQHLAIITQDIQAAEQRLRDNSVEFISHGIQRLPDWNPAAGGIEAFYFKDPDNHVLEILQFPAGKGNSKWHRPSKELFLGIDHTAIAVSDTEKSLSYYQGVLGFVVSGTSENYGPEQESLNNVPGAHLRITGLRAGFGPAIELLEYLSPKTGRPIPSDIRLNDLQTWQIELQIHATEKERPLNDPDGHLLSLIERKPKS